MASIIRILIETFHVPLSNCPFEYALIRTVQKARLFYYCPCITGASKPGRASPQRFYRFPTERLRPSTVCHPRKCGGRYWTLQGVISRVVQVNFKDSMYCLFKQFSRMMVSPYLLSTFIFLTGRTRPRPTAWSPG